ncbi:hypothetical protein [Flavobacterium sp. N1994]|uniref:hypothetical protein n=1 Tax=Flavobacterium sp. N1994 TaxID=2986827 RepID=UPI00222236EF|nr:hypothetical protein [Flavobacterium sp. N1994]
MEEKILFYEEQKFKQWWLWLLLIGLNGIFLFGIYQQIVEKVPFGDNPTSDSGLYIGFGLMLLLTLMFGFIKLQTQIKSDGVYVRFYPFRIQYRKYTWDNLNKLYVRKYSPITEYGGWGIRYGLFGAGEALNVSGNQGLQLVTTNNAALLIGTNKPEALKEVLTQIGQYKP